MAKKNRAAKRESPSGVSMVERLGFITHQLVKGHNVSIKELQTHFPGVSERTLRYDLEAVRQLRPQRFRGGLGTAEAFQEVLYHEIARTQHLEAKMDVARKAVECFDAGTSIAASPGSQVALTTAELDEKGKAAAIITNSLAVAEQASPYSSVTLVGGRLDRRVNALVGSRAEDGFAAFACRDALLGVSGVGNDGKLYVHHEEEVGVLRKLLESVTEKIVIVADVFKINKRDLWNIGDFDSLSQRNRRVFLVTNDVLHWKDDLSSQPQRFEEVLETIKDFDRKENLGLRVAKRG
jgi:DeoR/GlpR family transcriptional regulator of sugar metabolism